MLNSPPYLPAAEFNPSSPELHYEPPRQFVESYWDWNNLGAVATGRLVRPLREAAAAHDPMFALKRSVLSRVLAARRGQNPLEGNAFADLAVSGRASFERFRRELPSDEGLRRAVATELAISPRTGLAAEVGNASDEEIARAAGAALDRAYTVVWALRGSPAERERLRPGLGWIAVSSEDDQAHAPANTGCTSDPMGEFLLRIPGTTQRLACRAAIKVADPVPNGDRADAHPRNLPVAAERIFRNLTTIWRHRHYDTLILFLHGLGSVIEESENFKRRLIDEGLKRGRRHAVLSVDMPGFGYSSTLDIDQLVRDRVHEGPHGFRLPDGRQSNFPLFGMYRDALLAIGAQVRGGFQYAMGGSMGGNLTLWLAERPAFTTLPDASTAAASFRRFASWSPASIWESYERSRDTFLEGNGTHMDIGKNGVKKRTLARMGEGETPGHREGFFRLMQQGEEILGGLIHAGAWGHPPTKSGMLKQSELYSPSYRRTFWTACYEQAVFSHQEPLIDNVWPFRTITRPLLLASGERDAGDHGVFDFYNQVQAVTNQSPDVPGRRLLMQQTGHSISDERPQHLSREVAAFFDEDSDNRTEANLVVAPDVGGTQGNDLWVMRFNRRRRAWEHLSPIARHPFNADVNCDGASRPSSTGVKLIVTGDFDGDGQREVAVAPALEGAGGNEFWVMKYSRSSGAWSHLGQIPEHPFGADFDCDAGAANRNLGVKFALSGDFDGDGQDEMVVAPSASAETGTNLWAMKWGTTARRWEHMSPIAGNTIRADLNCDGRVGAASTAGVKFGVVGDFDGDGQDELVVAPELPGTQGNDLWAMKWSAQARRWEHMSPIAGHGLAADINCDAGIAVPTVFGVKLAVAGDFDGDGQDELIVIPQLGGTLGNDAWAMKFNPALQKWEHMSPIPRHSFAADLNCDEFARSPGAFGIKFAAVGDFDGDGADELVVAPDTGGTGGNDLWVLKFVPAARRWIHLSPMAGHPFGADLNCDLAAPTPTPYGIKFIVAADFDGDGKDELVIGPDTPNTGGNDLWAMKFDTTRRVWEHMSPDANHPFRADLNCDLGANVPAPFGAKFAVAGRLVKA